MMADVDRYNEDIQVVSTSNQQEKTDIYSRENSEQMTDQNSAHIYDDPVEVGNGEIKNTTGGDDKEVQSLSHSMESEDGALFSVDKTVNNDVGGSV